MKVTDHLGSVNLRELFTEGYKDSYNLPSEYVIYCIHNDLNDKCYIGQAREFYSRFIGSNGFSHLTRLREHNIYGGNSAIYNAISKYGSRNFTVYILDEVESIEDLDEREKFRIKQFHSCVFDTPNEGYNLNWGGNNCDHLHSAEVLEKIALKWGGDICGMLHEEDVMTRSRLTRESKWNGDSMGACHTEESLEKARVNMKSTKLFQSIEYCLSEIRHGDEVIDWDKYWHDIPYKASSPWTHVRRVLEFINELRNDSRWTSEMEGIFGFIEKHRDEYNI